MSSTAFPKLSKFKGEERERGSGRGRESSVKDEEGGIRVSSARENEPATHVALSRPPRVCPSLREACSVASPRSCEEGKRKRSDLGFLSSQQFVASQNVSR